MVWVYLHYKLVEKVFVIVLNQIADVEGGDPIERREKEEVHQVHVVKDFENHGPCKLVFIFTVINIELLDQV